MSNKKKNLTKLPIDPDMLQNDVVYTFTLNPADTYQYNNKDNRIKLVTAKVIANLLHYKNFCKWMLVPEFSTPECYKAVPRLHFHGTIKFTNVMAFYIKEFYLLKKWCQFEIDTIDDKKHWKSYVTKNASPMEAYYAKYKIPYVLTDKQVLYKPRPLT